MTAAAPTPGADRPDKKSTKQAFDRFFVGLFALALTLVLSGVGAFVYLRASSPLTLLSQSDRPIAAATAFVPDRTAFSVSLLARPERLIALQQAMASPASRQQFQADVAELKQTVRSLTGLDYDEDIQPWLGEEITFAFTEADLDIDASNGDQPGYLLALEIAPGQQRQAQSFLLTLWQQRSFAGSAPQSQQISGVRVLSVPSDSGNTGGTSQGRSLQRGQPPFNLTAASALVGDRFVLFSNDVRVLQRSIRSAQTAQTLAQSAEYRAAVAKLPDPRVGLAYFDAAALFGEQLEGAPSESLSSPDDSSRPKRDASRVSR